MSARQWAAQQGVPRGGPTRMGVKEFVRQEQGLPPEPKAKKPAPVKVLPTQAQLLAQSVMHAERQVIVNVTIPGEPVAKGRPRFDKDGHAYTPAKTRQAEKAVQAVLIPAMAGRAAYVFGDVDVDLTFWLAGAPEDLDNLVKLVWDSANGIVWRDDRQVRELRVRRRLDSGEPRTVFAVRPSDGPGEWRRCARCGAWTKNARFCGRVCR